MSAFRVAAGIEGYFCFLARVLAEGEVPELVERAGKAALDFGMVEPGADATQAASARARLQAADWRSVEELSLAGRNPSADLGACARLALDVVRRGTAALDSHEDVARIAVREAAGAVRVEIHRLLGILRFAPLGERAWLASCSPDNEVLELLIPHFAERLGADGQGPIPFAIRDEGRDLSVGRDARGGRFIRPALSRSDLASLLGLEAREAGDGSIMPGLGAGDLVEDEDESLWRTYFQAAGNPARSNPALQRRFVPERYREWLPEFRD